MNVMLETFVVVGIMLLIVLILWSFGRYVENGTFLINDWRKNLIKWLRNRKHKKDFDKTENARLAEEAASRQAKLATLPVLPEELHWRFVHDEEYQGDKGRNQHRYRVQIVSALNDFVHHECTWVFDHDLLHMVRDRLVLLAHELEAKHHADLFGIDPAKEALKDLDVPVLLGGKIPVKS